MVYAILSDIHSNLEALRAVLADIDRRSVDVLLCLGDLVGYNADPDACVELVCGKAAALVRGNHDKAVAGFMSLDWFNHAAREAARWTQRVALPGTLERIRGLPEGPVHVGAGVLLCHGSPSDEDEYLLAGPGIRDAFRFLEERMPDVQLCFHGHTHVPLAAAADRGARRGAGTARILDAARTIQIDPGKVYLLNPGSVGQPRDGNTLASFGILDTGSGTFTNIRVAYAFGETQRKILEAGLPPVLARRLGEGR